jgi:murein DD-endopeptidase MepM/ murein hydrolase activator NlpD
MRRLVGVSLALFIAAILSVSPAPPPIVAAQTDLQAAARPFGLPFDTPPGPSTWLLGQLYGNTTTAFRWRVSEYGAGQGLHFGIDWSAPCGTTVVSIGDGVVAKVDAAEHGAGPHNLVIDHPNGYASLYGHLYERPHFSRGDVVSRGQAIGLTGDPDVTCTSRPHLHLEVRDAGSYRRAFNPVPLIDANWDLLALASGSGRGFERDLDNPRQWVYMDVQPEVAFGGPVVNHYRRPWPVEWAGP